MKKKLSDLLGGLVKIAYICDVATGGTTTHTIEEIIQLVRLRLTERRKKFDLINICSRSTV